MNKYLEDKKKNFLIFIKLCRKIQLSFKENSTVIYHLASIVKMMKKKLPSEILFSFLQNAASEASVEMRRAIQPSIENSRVIEALTGKDNEKIKILFADAKKEEEKSLALKLWRHFWMLDILENFDFRKENSLT
ncbi:MAG: hypothetical protein ABIG60_02920 [Patescibacteria group bacterium]